MARQRTRFSFSVEPRRERTGVALAGLRVGGLALHGATLDSFAAASSALAGDTLKGVPAANVELRLRRQDPPMAPLDELVLLLQTAAEIEHALMAQYLYAAYSLPDQSPQSEWRDTLIGIARQEMGHLMAIQNLLLAIGAPLNFEREDYPFNAFYPFPFRLEPLSVASLARYVLAEMPDPSAVPEVDPVALLADAGAGQEIPRVGTLFVAMAELMGELSEDPVFADSLPFQADPSEWIAEFFALVLSKVKAVGEASQLLDAIAAQGEGPNEPPAGQQPSHFRRFHSMYLKAKEHVAATGMPLSDALPVDPTVRDPQAAGYLQNPSARARGDVFNMRYRCLLFALEFQLALPGADEGRTTMRMWAFADMRALRDIASLLKVHPQHEPVKVDEFGRRRVAGAPFEMPRSLQLPNRPIDRWRQLHQLVEFHRQQLLALEGEDDLAAQLAEECGERLAVIAKRLADA